MTEPYGDHGELLIGDDELLSQVREGDTDAFESLYTRHAGAARGLARQLVRGDSEVDDVVAETFTRVLSVVRRGGGPRDGFRPYLLTALRHVVYDRARGEKRQVVTDEMEHFDSGEPFVDPAVEGLERSLIARAYLSLPERWQAVLWYTEIEGVKPAEAAPSLGMKPNSVAALAYRAREGLRQAYLQMHLAGSAAETCRPALDRLGAYVRGALAKRDTALVDRHLDECADCREVYAELMDVNVGLRGIILPLFAGPAAAGYLAALPAGPLAGGWWARLPKGQQQAVAGGAATAAVAAAVAVALVANEQTVPEDDPPAAAPPAPSGEQPAPPGPRPEPPAPPGPPDARPPQQQPPGERPRPAEPAPPGAPDAAPPDRPQPPEARPAAAPAFTAAIDPVGALVPGRAGIVVLSVRNTGGAADDDVTADITLPAGVTVSESARAGNAVPFAEGTGDWSCGATAEGGNCVTPGIAAGDTSTQYIDVDVASDADSGGALRVSVRSGGVRATATGSRGVDPEGTAARYATAGRVRAETVGGALQTCVPPEPHTHWWPWTPEPGWPFGPEYAPPEESPAPSPPAPSAPEAPAAPPAEPPAEADDHRPPRPAPPAPPTSPRPSRPPAPLPPQASPTAPTPQEPAPPRPSAPAPPAASTGPSAPPSAAPPAGDGRRGHRPPPCAEALDPSGVRLDNDHWRMRRLDLDDDPDTRSSSSAAWELPRGGAVRWAGLYFSAVGAAPERATAALRGPGAATYTTVTAESVRPADLPGYPAYQAFAEVTDLVRAHGGGRWWAADIPQRTGVGTYAGWSLVVVVEDPAAPVNQAMVLDSGRPVFHDPRGARLPLAGLLPSAVPATVDVIAWEGDTGLGGDRVLLNDRPLTPAGGDPDNAFTGTARGARGNPHGFGTDVRRFSAVLPREPELRLVSAQDAYLAGAVAVTAPLRT
ncbi:sigma-70 family RNA polymerase sigma factor [Streptomonospora sp. S1-112]|uniref:Sigma-70 family RNA polymerase sigma factor n=1 Tax=Streptomonospora mangrovi TaxID=2883123 RepID=A0A9X3NMC6_9ACTN|nr:sigma-70 family RNA polymerase sigma factor [Streptomonospora mangrovi]MDA0564706.1 sigma-70 family RNA polymerase sigma factor [Streptomonospora mangrovi]